MVAYLFTSDPLDLPDPGAVWSSAAFTVLLVAVLTVAWSGSGRTLGNSVHGAARAHRIGDAAQLAAGAARARSIVVYIPVVSMLWILVSRKNAGLHDLVVPHHGGLRLAGPRL